MNRLRPRRPQSRNDPGRLHLWPIGWALAASFVITMAALAVLAWAALALLHYPGLPHQKTISVHDSVGVAQLVFASVAGAGALVALVVAYRRQRVAETSSVHERTRVLNERFTAIAAQLGEDQAAVRLAGVHAMAGLADDWEENRQTCIDVLCAYLRMPYEADPGEEAPATERLAFRADREVRHTAIRVITAHLREGAAVSWQGLDFDFTGVVFDGGSFYRAVFSGGKVSFEGAMFRDGRVSFADAMFSGAFVSFQAAEFSTSVSFVGASFYSGTVNFYSAVFSGGLVNFGSAKFAGGQVTFHTALFRGGEVSFDCDFCGSELNFYFTRFSGGQVDFMGAVLSSGSLSFNYATFSAGKLDFSFADFSGASVRFTDAKFLGGIVDFSEATLSHPPQFPWEGAPPPGVRLPAPDAKEP
jgi:uncharacterized protein YjbI with pentapeptide repeats